MSVAPDFLLQSVPEVRPKAPPAAPRENGAEPVKNGSSNFSEVYARERQVKAAERKETSTKADEKRQSESPEDASPASEASGQQSEVAESGKALPEEGKPGEEALDPLLLMAMAGQQPANSAQTEADADSAEDGEALLQVIAAGVTGEGDADPELDGLDGLDELQDVKLAQESARQGAQAGQSLSPGALAAQRANNPDQGLDNAVMSISSDAESGEEIPLEGLESKLLGAMDDQGGARDGQGDVRAESFAGKLNMLTQAINQQGNAAQRLPQVPGQPLQVGHPGMSEAVVDKVMWLSSQNLKSAEIQLHPAELGRLEVRIEMNKDQAAQVTFVSASAQVRDQLEGQAHRLRELFAQQGMNQLDVNVSDQSMSRSSQGGEDGSSRRYGGRGTGHSEEEEIRMGVSEIRMAPGGTAARGLVDYYA